MKWLDLKLLYKLIILRIKMILIIVGISTSIACILLLLEKPIYLSEAKLLFIEEDKMGWLDKLAPLVEESRAQASEKFDTELQLMKSKDTIKRVVSEVNLLVRKDIAISEANFKNNVKIFRQSNTNILNVQAITNYPQLSFIIADVYSKHILKQNVDIYQETNRKVELMIQDQLEFTRHKIIQYQEDLKKTHLSDSDANNKRAEDLSNKINFLDSEISKYSIDLKIAEKRKYELDKEFEQGGEFYIKYLQSPILKNMVQKREKMQKNHEDIAEINNKIRDELISLSRENGNSISGYYDNLLTKIKNQVDSIKDLKDKVQVYSEERSKYSRGQLADNDKQNAVKQLEKLLQIEQENYFLLIKKLQEAQISKELNVGNLKLIETPDYPKEAIHTGRKQKLVLVFFVSLLISIGLVVLRDFFENTFDAYEELLYYKDFSLALGYIPLKSKKQKILTEELPRSPFVESFKEISTHMRLHYSNYKVVSFASLDNLDDSAYVAINFAINEAISGKSVLLVDANYRAPSIARKLNIPNKYGLNEFINGNPENAVLINDLPVEKLQFVGTGDIPGNPIDLFIKDKFTAFIELLKQKYDLIVFYLPPANLYTDALIVSSKSDGIIFIAQEGLSKVSVFKNIIHKFQQLKINVFGTVMCSSQFLMTDEVKKKSFLSTLFYVTIVITLISFLAGLGTMVLESMQQEKMMNNTSIDKKLQERYKK
ncbi:MAG: GNVR domain-containing protein [Candidatus Margulisbacteria bacterium]|nr:GNVR domain-containing protein [Candidatus Margulisiibacteriota bacterium]